MTGRIGCVLLLGLSCAVAAYGAPRKHHTSGQPTGKQAHAGVDKAMRHDPAFLAGFDDGYHQGSNDSGALSNAYRDESGPLYQEALDGYTPAYGDPAAYQKLFREGYVRGYKEGWDFNSGQYNPLGAGGGGGSGG